MTDEYDHLAELSLAELLHYMGRTSGGRATPGDNNEPRSSPALSHSLVARQPVYASRPGETTAQWAQRGRFRYPPPQHRAYTPQPRRRAARKGPPPFPPPEYLRWPFGAQHKGSTPLSWEPAPTANVPFAAYKRTLARNAARGAQWLLVAGIVLALFRLADLLL